jgi:hypothetical protein
LFEYKVGYCQYYTNPNGNAVATWVGTGTDAGKTKRVIFLKGSAGAKSKTAACNNARDQFCKENGIGGRCYAITSQVKCANNLIEQGVHPDWPPCGNLTYAPDPIKGTGGLSTKGGPSEFNQTPAQRKATICAKNCGWDPICLYDKVKEECGGGPSIWDAKCFGIPCLPLAGAVVLLLILWRR